MEGPVTRRKEGDTPLFPRRFIYLSKKQKFATATTTTTTKMATVVGDAHDYRSFRPFTWWSLAGNNVRRRRYTLIHRYPAVTISANFYIGGSLKFFGARTSKKFSRRKQERKERKERGGGGRKRREKIVDKSIVSARPSNILWIPSRLCVGIRRIASQKKIFHRIKFLSKTFATR